jgi:hypothetical protein
MKKGFNRGEGNSVPVLGEGNSPADHGHVSRATPLQTKMKELSAARLGTELAPDIDKNREQRTTRLRRAKDVRPL